MITDEVQERMTQDLQSIYNQVNFEVTKDFAHVYQSGRNSRIYLSSKLYDGLNHFMTFSAVSVIQKSPSIQGKHIYDDT